jgi:hypothetical protein
VAYPIFTEKALMQMLPWDSCCISAGGNGDIHSQYKGLKADNQPLHYHSLVSNKSMGHLIASKILHQFNTVHM